MNFRGMRGGPGSIEVIAWSDGGGAMVVGLGAGVADGRGVCLNLNGFLVLLSGSGRSLSSACRSIPLTPLSARSLWPACADEFLTADCPAGAAEFVGRSPH